MAMISTDFLYGLCAGLGLVLVPWLVSTIIALSGNGTDVYGLQHWKLNARLPPESMWMNLGYWQTAGGLTPQVLRDACTALLHEVIVTCGLLPPPLQHEEDHLSEESSGKAPNPIVILDLGFGCGDQTLEIVRLAKDRLGSIDGRGFSYVGLTLNAAQAKLAADRLARRQTLACGSEGSICPLEDRFQLFCADASNPRSWSPAVRQALEKLGSIECGEKWLLALDCLYHFSPSRRPIFEYVGSAQSPFHANITAFDLLLSDSAGSLQRLAVKLVAVLMGCPSNAFLTEDCYRRQLIDAGYQEGNILVRDVTENVFPGLVAFLQRQDALLQHHGLSLGRLSAAKKVFEWLSKSNVLRAAIVVARKDG